MDADIRALIQNVVGGILASLLTILWVRTWTRVRRFHLARVIGAVLKPDTTVSIAYGQLSLPRISLNNKPITHPYIKVPRLGGPAPLQGMFSIEHPVSECEVRASTYVARLLGQTRSVDVKLISDFVGIGTNEGNFVTLGGPGSNYKTADVLACPSNIFVRMEHEHFSLISGERLAYDCTQEYDHGFVLRVRSPNFPDCSLLVCAGLGEWGTSGAAWFLSRKWGELMKYGDSWRTGWGFRRQHDFLAIVKVTRRQDDSASLVAYFREEDGRARKIL